MKEVIDIGLPPLNQPFSWAVKAPSTSNMLFTAHGPVRKDGTIHTGSIEEQTRLTFDNLRMAVTAAGGTMDDVTQVLIYMVDIRDMKVIDQIYQEYFKAPYPNRSSAGVAALVVPNMKLEIVAYAMIPPK